jgi:hypothetical protein
LYFVPATRRHVLLCGSGGGEGERGGHYGNVLAFDFFLRILCFGLFWYIWYYDPRGTWKPNWANNLG